MFSSNPIAHGRPILLVNMLVKGRAGTNTAVIAARILSEVYTSKNRIMLVGRG